MLLALPAAAMAAKVRFVHAVPGAGEAVLAAGDARTDAAGFGEVTGYASLPGDAATLAVRPAGGGAPLIRKRVELRGSYTAVAWRRGDSLRLDLYREGTARGGVARLRAVHAAGEVDEASVSLDGEVVAPSLGPGEATGYQSVQPGTHELSLGRPGGGGDPLLSRPGVDLTAGVATTAIAIGSGGEPTRIVLASDATKAPARAPETGLGGLGGTPWLAVLAAALAGAALGAGGWMLSRRRAA
jgi:hypothetical protein